MPLQLCQGIIVIRFQHQVTVLGVTLEETSFLQGSLSWSSESLQRCLQGEAAVTRRMSAIFARGTCKSGIFSDVWAHRSHRPPLRVEMPITRLEWWSTSTATHQQNGQHWGNANGNHGIQKPADIGTAVR